MTRWLMLIGLALAPSPLMAAEPGDLYESSIRPLIANHCGGCHGAKKQSGGVRLDSPEAIRAAAKSRNSLLKANDGELLKLISHDDPDAKMPPDKKLPDAALAAFRTWIAQGATLPRPVVQQLQNTRHWAFQPPQSSAPPQVRDVQRVRTPIDRFLLQKLEAKKLTYAPLAEPRVWLRRVTYSLTGLPPSEYEIVSFLADRSPTARETVVNRLLASSAYAEHQARWWLDLVRYADGSQNEGENDQAADKAYLYRDWLVSAFARNMNYQEFLLQQLAADKLLTGDDTRSLAALGFYTVSRSFNGNENDRLDDWLDVTSRGLMGLSVTCARCHDHKYDPVPTADYYSLAAVLRGSTLEARPLLADRQAREKYVEWQAELDRLDWLRSDLLDESRRQLLKNPGRNIGRYLLAISKLKAGGDPQVVFEADDLLAAPTFDRFVILMDDEGRYAEIFRPWRELLALPADQFAAKAPGMIESYAAPAVEGQPGLLPEVMALFVDLPEPTLEKIADRYQEMFRKTDDYLIQQRQDARLEGEPIPDPRAELGDGSPSGALRALLTADNDPFAVPENELMERFEPEVRTCLSELTAKTAEWRDQPDAPRMAQVLVDPENLPEAKIFLRGNPDNQGADVPRQFPSILQGKNRKPFREGNGRLEMARAVASSQNPLTARVFVNRIWQQHFGEGLVRTPSDFGTRGEAPSHPELLDWLTLDFIDSGWSIPHLHRQIVLSSAFAQSSTPSPAALANDGENRLLSRMNRQRLTWEMLRDTLLLNAGVLDREIGGPAIDGDAEPLSARRTIYQKVIRGNLSAGARAFDFAPPEMHSPSRHETITPRQALYMLNSPFVAEAARTLGEQVEPFDPAEPVERFIIRSYRRIFGRDPEAREIARATKFLNEAAALKDVGPAVAQTPWQYGTAPWNVKSRKAGRFLNFQRFDNGYLATEEAEEAIRGIRWSPPEGTSVAGPVDHPAVRRFIAPQAGKVTLHGTLKQANAENADAKPTLAACIVYRGKTVWQATTNSEAKPFDLGPLDLRAGETVDFIVSSTNPEQAGFSWPVAIEWRSGKEVITYDSDDDFEGPNDPPLPPLSPRAKLIQTLWLTDEWLFID